VADFRRRDIAAGGEGAPLVPAFHAEVFADPEITRAILNIGGIANISLLQRGDVSGFDTGPGNTLLDHWSLLRRGEAYDAGGSWAAEGRVNEALLGALLAQEYFAAPSPKSTGKETFNPGWLDSVLSTLDPIAPGDVQATLAELTAVSISNAIKACSAAVQEVYVCGGGAANTDLMRRLYKHLPNIYLGTTADLGVDPDWVEAAAFAWLAWRTLERLPGNRPDVTGARGPRVLGAIYPGG